MAGVTYDPAGFQRKMGILVEESGKSFSENPVSIVSPLHNVTSA